MTWVDWLLVGILALSGAISFKRGFVKESLSLAIWAAAFFIASTFSPLLAPLLLEYIEAASLRQMAAFAILFVLTLVTGGGVNYLISTLIQATGLTGTDRMLGVIFGVARGWIIVMLLVIYLPKLLPVKEDLWWQQSLLIPYFEQFQNTFDQLTTAVVSAIKSLFN